MISSTTARPTAPRSAVGGIAQLRTGLDLPHQVSFATWLNIGMRLSSIATSSAWCLGDWLAYGETHYSGRYRDAIEQTSLEYKTLRNYAWVTRRFSLARRHEGLSFGHHAEVAALSEPEQDFWLRKAEALRWSRNDLRREVRASLRERAGVPDQAATEDDAPARLPIGVTVHQLDIIRQAAAKAGLSVDMWAALTLERAARHLLLGQPGLAARVSRQGQPPGSAARVSRRRAVP